MTLDDSHAITHVKKNHEFNPEIDDYQEIVANMESVVTGLPGMDRGNKRLLRLMHAMMGMVTEAGEMADQFKRHIYYKQTLDEPNVIEELGDCLWYIALACNVMKITIKDVQIANIRKLQRRYPEKFTVHHATNRDTEEEIKALQNSINARKLQDQHPEKSVGDEGPQNQIRDPASPKPTAAPRVINDTSFLNNVEIGDYVTMKKVMKGKDGKETEIALEGKVLGKCGKRGGGLPWNHNWVLLLEGENGKQIPLSTIDEWRIVVHKQQSTTGTVIGVSPPEEEDAHDEYIQGMGPTTSGMIYLACPRRHEAPQVMDARCDVADYMMRTLMQSGKMVFSPISHGHRVAKSVDWTFKQWEKFDLEMLSRCDSLHVIKIDGWKESVGVQAEIKHAVQNGIEVVYLDPEDYGLQSKFPYFNVAEKPRFGF